VSLLISSENFWNKTQQFPWVYCNNHATNLRSRVSKIRPLSLNSGTIKWKATLQVTPQCTHSLYTTFNTFRSQNLTFQNRSTNARRARTMTAWSRRTTKNRMKTRKTSLLLPMRTSTVQTTRSKRHTKRSLSTQFIFKIQRFKKSTTRRTHTRTMRTPTTISTKMSLMTCKTHTRMRRARTRDPLSSQAKTWLEGLTLLTRMDSTRELSERERGRVETNSNN
jgi:hypothetical protein